MIDWTKPVQTDTGSEVIKLDDNFESPYGKATLFKVKRSPHLSSDRCDWVGYQVHSDLKCYAIYADQGIYLDIKNVPVKREGWIAIYPTKNGDKTQHCSDIYSTIEFCRKTMEDNKLKVVCYRRIEWEEPY